MALTRSMERRLNEASTLVPDAIAARDDVIIAAFKAGGSMGEIGLAVGMSHVGVGKLLARLGVRIPPVTVEQANAELAWRDTGGRGRAPTAGPNY